MIFTTLSNVSFKIAKKIVLKEKYVEFRLDLLNLTYLEYEKLIKCSKRSIVSFRSKKELKDLDFYLSCKPNFIDLDYNLLKNDKDSLIKKVKSKKIKTIISYHNYNLTPFNLNVIYKSIKSQNPDIIKIATKVNKYGDNISLLKYASPKNIIIGLGKKGLFSRIMALKMGCFGTFVSISNKNKAEKSQMSRKEIIKFLEFF